MSPIGIENGVGLGLGMFAPFGDGALGGAFVPRFPCTFGAAVTWGYSRYGPFGAGWNVVVSGDGWRTATFGAGWNVVVSGDGWRTATFGAGWHVVVSGGGWRIVTRCFARHG